MQCDYMCSTTSGLNVCCILDSGHNTAHRPDEAVKPGELAGPWRRGAQGACAYKASFLSEAKK